METGVGMYVTREAVLTHPNVVDQDDAVLMEEPTPAVRKKKSKTTFGGRSRHRDSPSSSDESGSEDHRRPHRRSHSRASRSGRRSPSSRSSRSSRSGRSGVSAASGSTQIALNMMTQVQDAMARMEHRQGTTLEKIVENLEDKLKKPLDERIKETVPKKEPCPAPEDKFRSAEDLDKAWEEDARLEHERATALFAQYQEQLRTRQDEDSRQTLFVMTALQQEQEAMKLDRNQERETVKNLQTFLANQVRDLRSTVAQSAGSAQPPVPSRTQTARPESRSKYRGEASRPRKRSSTENADGLFAAQLQATLAALVPKAAKQPERSAAKAEGSAKTEPSSGSKTTTSGNSSKTATSGSANASKKPPSSSKKDKPSKKENSKKRPTRDRGDPSSSEPDSDGDPSDHDSDGSNSSSFEDIIPKVKGTTSLDGVTPFVFRPYVNASHLEDFDEKLSLSWLDGWRGSRVWRYRVAGLMKSRSTR
jgi:hypothetical protein